MIFTAGETFCLAHE